MRKLHHSTKGRFSDRTGRQRHSQKNKPSDFLRHRPTRNVHGTIDSGWPVLVVSLTKHEEGRVSRNSPNGPRRKDQSFRESKRCRTIGAFNERSNGYEVL